MGDERGRALFLPTIDRAIDSLWRLEVEQNDRQVQPHEFLCAIESAVCQAR